MAQDDTPRGFLKLPMELRLRCYEVVLLASSPITIADVHPRFKGHLSPQLLRTCRQLHNEGADVLYGCNTFETLLHQNGRLVRHLNKWLRNITETNVARLNRLKFQLLYPAPTRKGSSGLFHVETTFRLLKVPSWSYVARYQAFGPKWWSYQPAPESIEIQLEPDAEVEEQLEVRFRTKAILGAPWLGHDIAFLCAAVAEIRPRLGKGVDVARLPESVVAFFEKDLCGARG